MITFLKGSDLSQALEEMIQKADKFLWLISPYIKLSGRIKDELKRINKKHSVQICIVYGKNEDNKSKSLSQDDFEFLKSFPNIMIGYEKNLHAKYYGSEDFSLLCSMNLHEFSQNNNVEAGFKIFQKDLISGTLSTAFTEHRAEIDSYNYFKHIIDNCEIEFHKVPKYEKGLLGLTSNYTNSEIIVDHTSNHQNFTAPSKSFAEKPKSIPKVENVSSDNQSTGYCIRTGEEIPYDVNKPYSYKAFKSWVQFENVDFPENYCHKTGKPSNKKTSMRNPILNPVIRF